MRRKAGASWRSWAAPFARLLRYARPYWKGWALVLLATPLSSLLTIAQPWPMKIVVDSVLGHQPLPPALARALTWLPGSSSPQSLLTWAVLGGLFLFALNSALEAVLVYTWVRAGQRMVYDLAGDLFARLQRRSLLFHGQTPVGDSLSRITGDSWCIYTVLDTILVAPARALFTAVGMILVMARIDAPLTLAALAVAPFMGGSSLLFGRSLRATARARREIQARIQDHVQQTLSSIPVVQAFAQEDREMARFQEFAGTAIRAEQRNTLALSIYDGASGLVGTLGTAVIIGIGALHVIQGRFTVGSLLMFIFYLNSLQEQLRAFTGVYGALEGAGASVDRVLAVLDAPQEVPQRTGAAPLPRVQGHIRFENISFGYEPDCPVLRELSLEVSAGQTVAIVGPSGTGKSTLVSLLPRFFDPWAGRVLIDGRDVRDVQLDSLRQQIALVLQEPFLAPLTLAQNIAYGKPQASRAKIEEAARAANAHDFIQRLPQGYDTALGENGATLSGGERQRVAIARALLKDAPILILDEPTSALDAESERLVMEALERLKAGRTTLMIAHRLSTVRRADTVVLLSGGRVAEAGSHAQLIEAGGAYARLYGLGYVTSGSDDALDHKEAERADEARRDAPEGVLRFS